MNKRLHLRKRLFSFYCSWSSLIRSGFYRRSLSLPLLVACDLKPIQNRCLSYSRPFKKGNIHVYWRIFPCFVSDQKRGQCPSLSHISFLLQACIASTGIHDQMVEHFHTDDLPGLHKTAGNFNIFRGRLHFLARMIMSDDDGGGIG